jgi:hypothetical protein
MEILLERFARAGNTTLGRYYINNARQHYILEDKDRDLHASMPLTEIASIKIWGKTAIPVGIYEVTMRWSPNFRAYLPYITGIPGFDLVMFHIGNWHTDTDGCLLPGRGYQMQENGDYMVTDSGTVIKPLVKLISDTVDSKERIWLHVVQNYAGQPA